MGRKPNQLILEFFERGPKLEDASNRYQHTCKNCGEKFPKGRLDSLTNHLVKKCPAIATPDRQRAILQFHDLPPRIPDNNGSNNTTGQGVQRMNLPFAPKESMSGLDALVEVSSRQLGLPSKQGGVRSGNKAAPKNSNSFYDEFLVQDEPRSDLSFGASGERSEGMPNEFDTHSDTLGQHVHGMPNMFQHFNGLPSSNEPPSLSSLPTSHNLTSSSSIVPPTLMMTASAAQDLLPNPGMAIDSDLGGGANVSMVESYLAVASRGNWGKMQQNNIDPSLQDTPSAASQVSIPDSASTRSPAYPRLLAINPNTPQTHFATDFSINPKPGKPKVRGRFTDSRRKEVQEVRKRGACIRCRMLKKPCSGETPCSTCHSVESARLWKAPCIRTRIAEEFNLYSAGLHSVLAFHALGSARGRFDLEKIPGRIEVKHLQESSFYATFLPLRGRKTALPSLDPLLFQNSSNNSLDPENHYALDADTDDLCGKLEQYIHKLTPVLHEIESSEFMKLTLSTLFALSIDTNDDLLPKSLELWAATSIVTDKTIQWQIFMNPTVAPSNNAVVITESDFEADAKESMVRQVIAPSENRESYNLIRLQLLGAAEKRASTLSKVIMNDIERRLLQRQQAKPFETYLVSIILLACVERMCWHFKSWEASTNPSSDQSGRLSTDHKVSPPSTEASTASDHPAGSSRWPLDQAPPYYSQQGERFSDILVMLLRMRGVPPKTIIRAADGVIVPTGDDTDPLVRGWFERAAVSNEWIVGRSSARYLGTNPNEWEGKYWGKVMTAGLPS